VMIARLRSGSSYFVPRPASTTSRSESSRMRCNPWPSGDSQRLGHMRNWRSRISFSPSSVFFKLRHYRPGMYGSISGQLAFQRCTLMRFIHALDAIFELTAVVRKLLSHFKLSREKPSWIGKPGEKRWSYT
jgi:hypothetical protein